MLAILKHHLKIDAQNNARDSGLLSIARTVKTGNSWRTKCILFYEVDMGLEEPRAECHSLGPQFPPKSWSQIGNSGKWWSVGSLQVTGTGRTVGPWSPLSLSHYLAINWGLYLPCALPIMCCLHTNPKQQGQTVMDWDLHNQQTFPLFNSLSQETANSTWNLTEKTQQRGRLWDMWRTAGGGGGMEIFFMGNKEDQYRCKLDRFQIW